MRVDSGYEGPLVVVAIEYMGGGRLICDAVHRTAAGIAEVAPSFDALTSIYGGLLVGVPPKLLRIQKCFSSPKAPSQPPTYRCNLLRNGAV
jgi:hypothetical protein